MKCIVLAGGSGNRLWPLSRINFPKQFLQTDENQSLFQQTVSRNMSLCDEVIVVTDYRYELIVKNQLRQFTGLDCTIITENAKGTLPAIVAGIKNLALNEFVLIVPSDRIIDSEGYRESIFGARAVAEQGEIALLECNKDTIISLSKVSVLKEEVRRFPNATNINKEIFDTSARTHYLKAQVSCRSFNTFDNVDTMDFNHWTQNTVANQCDNSIIINDSRKQLVVANHLKDITVVNCDDAVYISDRAHTDDIKDIVEESESFRSYFEDAPLSYKYWGLKERLLQTGDCRVVRATIYPGQSLSAHKHQHRTENITVVKGTLSVEFEDGVKTFEVGETATIVPGTLHRPFNDSAVDIEFLEVATGLVNDEVDMLKKSSDTTLPVLFKLSPFYKDYIWGGSRLNEEYAKDSPYAVTAESWELSAHKDGVSVIADGPYKGMGFEGLMKLHGHELCGWKANEYEAFPVLIKLIDATKALSVQIHPDDDYAFCHESEYGKNEMWYVLSARDGAYLYCGLKEDTDKAEIEAKIKDGTITDLLNKVEVKTGDVVFVPSKTLHAIGEGVVVYEIQQSSNSTYRVFDYGRVDSKGKPRDLHIEKAMDVVSQKAYIPDVTGLSNPEKIGDNTHQVLAECKYFRVMKFDVASEDKIVMDDASFAALTLIDGEAAISFQQESVKVVKGETIFVAAGRRQLTVKGKCSFLLAHL
ncbi:MAG: mannose-6-phosphate isomerase, class I [Pseudobutyrivibrio sp.]|nr:mannose-6-phosphate isomerase, class I [Pseudobutyrivibrio sp.]